MCYDNLSLKSFKEGHHVKQLRALNAFSGRTTFSYQLIKILGSAIKRQLKNVLDFDKSRAKPN